MTDTDQEQKVILETIMDLIMHGGDAKTNAVEAIQAAKEANFDLAEEKLEAADQALSKAHETQKSLLTRESRGEAIEISLLLIHGQDHLMNAITFKDLAVEVIDVYRRLEDE